MGSRKKAWPDFLNREHVRGTSYVLIRTRREQRDIGFEPNVNFCYGIGYITSAQQMLREGLRYLAFL